MAIIMLVYVEDVFVPESGGSVGKPSANHCFPLGRAARIKLFFTMQSLDTESQCLCEKWFALSSAERAKKTRWI